METMRAWVVTGYGGVDVLQCVDLPKPVPKDDEVLIRIEVTTVTAADWRIRTLDVPKGMGPLVRLAMGVRRPRRPVLGTELAGTVAAVGKAVTKFRPGDAVFGFPGVKRGAHAEYAVMGESAAVFPVPKGLSKAEAAGIAFGGTPAINFLRAAKAKAGDTILLIGASGNVGLAFLQLAKHLGARVTAVTSTGNIDLVKSFGADEAIDYKRTDILALPGGGYDIVIDAVGATTYGSAGHLARRGGQFIAVAGGVPDLLATAWSPLFGSRKVLGGTFAELPSDVAELARLAEAGAYRTFIDREYPFAEMREAHAYVATGRKRGTLIVRVAGEG